MDALYEILEDIRPDVDFRGSGELVERGDIDSFDIVTIIARIEEAYNVEVPVELMLPEHFNSAEAMMGLIQTLQG